MDLKKWIFPLLSTFGLVDFQNPPKINSKNTRTTIVVGKDKYTVVNIE